MLGDVPVAGEKEEREEAAASEEAGVEMTLEEVVED